MFATKAEKRFGTFLCVLVACAVAGGIAFTKRPMRAAHEAVIIAAPNTSPATHPHLVAGIELLSRSLRTSVPYETAAICA